MQAIYLQQYFFTAFISKSAPEAPEETHILIKAVVVLIVLMSVLLIYILISVLIKSKEAVLRKKLLKITDTVIQTIIFNEEPHIRIPCGLNKLLQLRPFRALLIDELVKAKRNFSGDAGENLQKLYRKAGLEADSLKKLNSFRWNIKAQGIQELAEMGINEHADTIFKLTNDKNEQIRIEAQNAVVMFSGFEGLSFLDFLTYPLSEWQQIKLISELGESSEGSSTYIQNWLSSNNYSVIIFSLRLVAFYHLFELQRKVIFCLSHPSAEVRFQAIQTLKEIYSEHTSAKLIENYTNESHENRLAILDTIKSIGTTDDVSFLMEEFRKEDHQIKLAAGRAIATLAGEETLSNSEFAGEYPWNIIIKQIKGELIA